MISKITGALMLAALLTVGCAKDQAGSEAGKDGSKAPSGTVATKEPGAGGHEASAVAVADLKADDPSVATIAVPTMSKGCGSCKKHVSEAVAAVPAVESYGVDNEARFVRVKLAQNTPEARQAVEQAITKVGYSTEHLKRDESAYKNLPECCQVGADEKSGK